MALRTSGRNGGDKLAARGRTGRRSLANSLKRMSSPGTVVVALVLSLFASFAPAARATTITDVQILRQSGGTRVVVEAMSNPRYAVFALADPYRIYVDFPGLDFQLLRGSPKPSAGVKAVRYGILKPGTSRMVLDASQPLFLRSAEVIRPRPQGPYQLVLDLAPTDRPTFTRQLGRPLAVSRSTAPIIRASSTPVVAPRNAVTRATSETFKEAVRTQIAALPAISLPREKPEPPKAPPPRSNDGNLPLVIIDPGHGGVDPGAVSPWGLKEKIFTLSMARQLRDVLRQSGRYVVRLTRDRDEFIALRDRIKRARSHLNGRDGTNALFISVHADSIRKRSIRGLSVYTLSEKASDKEAAELARRENKVDLIAGIELSSQDDMLNNILIDLTQQDSMKSALRFADILVDSMRTRGAKMLRNPLRSAGFAVLKAPDIPSVLLEMGYLSNRADERRLRDGRYRSKLARSVLEAIDSYFSENRRVNGV